MLELIEELREMDDQLIALGNGQYANDHRHGRIADEIEREISELQESWAQEAREHADDSARLAELAHENAELKREIAERYMELPVDADGVPIRVGDRMLKSTGAPKESFGEVVGVSEDSVWFAYENNGYESNWANLTRHVKPRTVEDILFDAVGDAEEGLVSPNEIIARYAAELRGMFGGE